MIRRPRRRSESHELCVPNCFFQAEDGIRGGHVTGVQTCALPVLRELHDQQVGLAVFPELSLTGYSLEDLVMQEPLLEDAEQAIATVVEASRELLPIILLGAPLRATQRNRLYHCATTIHRGEHG